MLRSLSALTVFASLVAAASLASVGMTTACSSSSSGSSSSGGGGSSSGSSCDTGGADGGACVAPGTQGETPTPPFVPCVTGSALQSPSVSFSKDIQPIFNASCAISGATCHGSPTQDPKATGQIYLGSVDGGIAASDILPKIVGQASPENPEMNTIKAGDPENSYLMHKLDGDFCQFAKNCAATMNPLFANCGVQMPFNSGNLDQDSRDKIRRWIAQGAQAN